MKFTHILLILWAFLFVNSSALEKIEGTLFPVIENPVVTKLEIVNNGIRFDGTFDKIRKCDYVSMSLVIRNPVTKTKTHVGVEFPTHAEIREPGHQEFQNWFARVTPAQIRNSDFYLVHNCRVPVAGFVHRVRSISPLKFDL